MSNKDIGTFCKVDEEGANLLKQAMTKLGLSARAYHKILKVSRTIADLEGKNEIQSSHIAEAIQYRVLDRVSRCKKHKLFLFYKIYIICLILRK